jgi:hypothetical protein
MTFFSLKIIQIREHNVKQLTWSQKERKKVKHLLANNTYNKKNQSNKHLINGQLGSDLSNSRIRRADTALWRSLRGYGGVREAS